MEKLFDSLVSMVQAQGGNSTLYFIAACVLALFAWHQYLRITRHKEDLERERLMAQSAKEELARLEARQPKREEQRADRRAPGRRATSRVLVVEDNDQMQLIIPAMLNKCLQSPEVKVSASTREALEDLTSFRPELLILDLNLGGQSGLDVLKHLQGTRPELPVLVYTGYEEELVRALELRRQNGLHNLTVLQKGPDIDAFVRLVPGLFKRRATDAPTTSPAPTPQGAADRDRRRRPGDRRAPLFTPRHLSDQRMRYQAGVSAKNG